MDEFGKKKCWILIFKATDIYATGNIRKIFHQFKGDLLYSANNMEEKRHDIGEQSADIQNSGSAF